MDECTRYIDAKSEEWMGGVVSITSTTEATDEQRAAEAECFISTQTGQHLWRPHAYTPSWSGNPRTIMA